MMFSRACLFVASIAIFLPMFDSANAQSSEVFRYRAWYREATTLNGAEKMAEAMALEWKTQPEDAFTLGFLAVSELMLADHAWNPLDKLAQFLEWQPQLDQAIDLRPDDPDLAFLRLGVQIHAPALLDYQSDIEHDKTLVSQALLAGHWKEDSVHESFVKDFLNLH